MINIVLCGAAGRMGSEIIKAAQTCDDLCVIAGVEKKGTQPIGGAISGVRIYDDILAVIQNADCVVDFTNHTASLEILHNINEYKKPFVTGTTGFSDTELQQIKKSAKTMAIFIAPNMSVGVNHLYNLVRSSAAALSGYDIEIIETHHKYKKDAPSGTAKAIAETIKEVMPDLEFVYGREGMIGERERGEICTHSVRGGDVVGEHRVLFLGNGEFLELRHFATSRHCFAVGALAAVRFIINKAPGLYSMQDLLKNR